MEASEPKEFTELLVETLELAAGGRSLHGSGRTRYLQAFRDCPHGTRIVTNRAISEATDRGGVPANPVGLALWMIGENEHHKAERAAADEVSF